MIMLALLTPEPLAAKARATPAGPWSKRCFAIGVRRRPWISILRGLIEPSSYKLSQNSFRHFQLPVVIPAQAGIQAFQAVLDARLRA